MKYIAFLDFGEHPPMQEINRLVSQEMQRVHQLEDLGVFESVKFLNFAKQVEILVNAPSEEEARQAVESLPLHAYFQYNLQPANAQQEAALTRKQPVRDMLRYLGLKH